MDKHTLDQLYQNQEYYWGKQPNQLAKDTVPYLTNRKTLIDLGAGEGRDSVFFAQLGMEVLAIDTSATGLQKATSFAQEVGTNIEILQSDLNDLQIIEPYDVIYSCGTLQYIEPQNRQRQFAHFKQQTRAEGIHILFAFMEHLDVEIAPDWGENEYLYQNGELSSYYLNWEILSQKEIIFGCHSSGIPHRHAAEVMIAKKVV